MTQRSQTPVPRLQENALARIEPVSYLRQVFASCCAFTVCCCAWQVSEAIQERAKRIYDKYGNVMLDVKGMTKAGVERKATCRALFSKLLYLAGNMTAPETGHALSFTDFGCKTLRTAARCKLALRPTMKV